MLSLDTMPADFYLFQLRLVIGISAAHHFGTCVVFYFIYFRAMVNFTFAQMLSFDDKIYMFYSALCLVSMTRPWFS